MRLTSVGASVVVVFNALHALGVAATAWRARFDLEVIGVTGSVGKTTTKQFITAALGGEAEGCYSTPGNANNEIGLPLGDLETYGYEQRLRLHSTLGKIGLELLVGDALVSRMGKGEVKAFDPELYMDRKTARRTGQYWIIEDSGVAV